MSAGEESVALPGSVVADEPVADEWGFTPVKMDFDEPSSAGLSLTISPNAAMYAKGHEITFFLRELERVGAGETKLDASALPTLDQLDPEASYLKWSLSIGADVSEALSA